MRFLLTLPALIVAISLAARADEANSYPSLFPSTGNTSASPAPETTAISADAATVEAPPMITPALPHYLGRGEWPGFGCGQAHGPACGGSTCGCQACDGATWCHGARPRTYHLRLWDNYCYESTRCPCCGYDLGGVMHYLKCERRRVDWGSAFGGSACGCGGANCGCAGPQPAADRPADAPAAVECQGAPELMTPTPAAPLGQPKLDVPPKAPMTKQPEAKEPMPKDMKDQAGKGSATTTRVMPTPRQTSLLDRLIPWRTSGAR